MSKAKEILDVIRKVLEEHPEFGKTTQTLYDPNKLQYKPSIGLMVESEGGLRLKFNVSVDDLSFGTEENK